MRLDKNVFEIDLDPPPNQAAEAQCWFNKQLNIVEGKLEMDEIAH